MTRLEFCDCGGIKEDGKCNRCDGQRKRTDDRTTTERGYGHDWQKLRARKMAQQPLCEECQMLGITKPAEQVDHIIPFEGLKDPKRFEWGNLRSLCTKHHNEKTMRDRMGQ